MCMYVSVCVCVCVCVYVYACICLLFQPVASRDGTPRQTALRASQASASGLASGPTMKGPEQWPPHAVLKSQHFRLPTSVLVVAPLCQHSQCNSVPDPCGQSNPKCAYQPLPHAPSHLAHNTFPEAPRHPPKTARKHGEARAPSCRACAASARAPCSSSTTCSRC